MAHILWAQFLILLSGCLSMELVHVAEKEIELKRRSGISDQLLAHFGARSQHDLGVSTTRNKLRYLELWKEINLDRSTQEPWRYQRGTDRMLVEDEENEILCQIFLQTESAYHCVSELGELGIVMFRDLNPSVNAFQRKFVNEVRRCDEMERKLRYLKHEIEKEHVPILESPVKNPEAPHPREMIDMEATFEKLESELREVTTNEDTLKTNALELLELKTVIMKAQAFFQDHEDRLAVTALHNDAPPSPTPHVELLDHEHVQMHGVDRKDQSELTYVTGIIRRDRVPGFERMLWRVSRGNAFLRILEVQEPFEDPVTGDPVHKCVFLIFFQGEQLKTRVKKICEGYRATIYHCPEKASERREILMGVATRLEDLKTVLEKTTNHRNLLLHGAAKNMNLWLMKVWKIKAIYHTLNLFNLDVVQKCLIAECWIPADRLDSVREALKHGTETAGSSVACVLNRMESDEPPPTYYRLNKFTKGFQNLVDSYGTSTYREMNPGPYTIISFPFLFGVMFGDLGHGAVMFIFALWMVLKERSLQKFTSDEIFRLFFSGRYIILLMGLFSMYAGFIYNEIFAKSFNIFGSGWRVEKERQDYEANALMTLDPNTTAWMGVPYPFGMDPIWNLAPNKLVFLNTFKMKMSVIIGVTQMFFGLMLSIFNYLYRKSKLEIFGVFIPQVLFLTSIFVYLCVLIIFKWVYFGTHAKPTAVGEYPGPYCAPQLLIGLINMVMMTPSETGWNYPPGTNPPQSCSMNYFFPGQGTLQPILVLIAVICVPWMLLTKPIGLIMMKKKREKAAAARRHISVGRTNRAYEDMSDDSGHSSADHHDSNSHLKPHSSTSDDHDTGGHGGGGHGHGGDSVGDIFTYQAIHTIEFCLGCISHTASYLRLWALSLAHSQLSEVLWTEVMSMGFAMFTGWAGTVSIYLIWWVFFALSLSILVMMEGLSAFLHALRLHCQNDKEQEMTYDRPAAELTRDLFKNYSHIVRPCGQGSTEGHCKPIEVTVNMKIISITSVDDDKMVKSICPLHKDILVQHFNMHFLLRQEWKDTRLSHKGKEALTLDSSESQVRIWTPDTFFLQEQGTSKSITDQSNNQFIVSPNGEIDYSQSLSITLACPMDLREYPFDTQACYFQLGSYAQPSDKLIFKWNEDRAIEIDPEARKNTPTFELGDVRKKQDCTYLWVTGMYSCLKAEIQFKRQFGFADWMKNYLPSFALVILSWLAFYLGTESIGIRALLGAGCMQFLLIHWSILAINLPHVAGCRAIDVWFIGCIILVGLSLVQLLLVIRAPAKRGVVGPAFEMIAFDKILEEPPLQKISRARVPSDASEIPRSATARRASVVKPPRKYTRLVATPASTIKDSTAIPMVPTSQYFEEPTTTPKRTGKLDNFRRLSAREKTDAVARLLFPVLFILFNIIYWASY